MDINTIDAIKKLVKQNQYSVKNHAHQRMSERNISSHDLEEVIISGKLIEKNPKNLPLPTFLFMKRVNNLPLYVVCAFDQKNKWLYIITVYWFDPLKWINPWTRK